MKADWPSTHALARLDRALSAQLSPAGITTAEELLAAGRTGRIDLAKLLDCSPALVEAYLILARSWADQPADDSIPDLLRRARRRVRRLRRHLRPRHAVIIRDRP